MNRGRNWFFIFIVIFVSVFGLGLNAFAGSDAFGESRGPNANFLTTLTVNSTEDTYITSLKESVSHGTEETVWVGYNRNQQFGIQRTLLKFNVSAIKANSSITQAELVMYLSATTPSDSAMNILVNRLKGDWSESITWTQFVERVNSGALIKDNTNTASKSVTANPNQTVVWNVTNLLQEWANESNRPDFLALVMEGNESVGQHERGFWSGNCSATKCQDSQKPQLIITYTDPPPTPTPTPVPTSTPGVRLDLSYSVNQSGSATMPSDPITIKVKYKVGEEDVTSLIITSTLTGAFTITDEMDGEAVGNTVVWDRGAQSGKSQKELSYTVQRTFSNAVQPGTLTANEVGPNQYSLIANLPPSNPAVPTCYKWDFGDGSASVQEADRSAILHTYNRPGRYVVTVVASQEPSYLAKATAPVQVTAEDIASSALSAPEMATRADCTLLQAALSAIGASQATATWVVDNKRETTTSNFLLIEPANPQWLPLIANQPQ